MDGKMPEAHTSETKEDKKINLPGKSREKDIANENLVQKKRTRKL
jgi:hypothetical protein